MFSLLTRCGKRLLFCSLLCVSVFISSGQTIEPTPLIKHYSVNIEDLYTIWDLVTTPSGTLLMAGENGLIEYDGKHFKKLLPGTILSVGVDLSDHTVYLGTDRMMGYITKDRSGKIQLHNLCDQLPDSIVLTFFRYVHITKRKVFFLSSSDVFEYDKAERTFFVYRLSDKIKNGFTVGDSLFVADPPRGLVVLHNKSISLAPHGEFFKGADLKTALTLPTGQHLLGWKELILYDHTGTAGPYPYQLTSNGGRSSSNAYASASFGERRVLLVHDVVPGGASIIDVKQNVLFRYKGTPAFSGSDLLSTGVDQQRNFWLGYYYTSGGALTKVEHGQDIKLWSKESGLPSSFYVTRFKGKLYVGTTNGLFVKDDQDRLSRLPQFEGPCYFLKSIQLEGKERLLLTDSDGLKEWTGNQLISIPAGAGDGFNFYQTRANPNRLILSSSGTALSILYNKGKWTKEYDIQHASIEALAEGHDGSIWMNVRDGIAKIETRSVPFRTTKYNLPDVLNGELTGAMFTSPKGDILLATSKGLFTFDLKTEKIIPWTGFGPTMAARADKVLFTTRLNDSTYFLTANNPSASLICTITKQGTVINDAPFKRLPDNGQTNCAWSDADGTIWLAGSYGLISYNPKGDTKDYNQPFRCLIQKVKVSSDSTIFSGNLSFIETHTVQPTLDYNYNQMQFEFAAPFFDKEEETLYSYRLVGVTDTWSEWDKVYYKEYSNLDEASYTFQVKARNIYGTESSIASYAFIILPPWYRTWWAYALYVLLAALAITVLIDQRTRYINQRRKELEKIVLQQTGELKASNEKLKASNENLILTQRRLVTSEKMASLGQLTAGITHEINNPINFISGGVQALREIHHDIKSHGHLFSKEELQIKNNEMEALMASVMNGVNRTSEIIKSLRQFSSPVDQLDETVFTDIPACISASLLIINSRIKEANIDVRTHVHVATHAHAIASQISQVLINLMSNAIDAVMLRSDERLITIAAEESASEIIIRVIDNGPGIPPEKQPHVFEPFFTTKSVGNGMGLGLFICYSIVQKHHGSLTFDSSASGTTFTVVLPKKTNTTA